MLAAAQDTPRLLLVARASHTLPRCRYNPSKGELTLTCEKFPDRDQNQRELLDTIHALIAEGEQVHPQTDPAIIQQQKERKAGRENLPPTPIPEWNPLKKQQQQ